MSTIASLFVTDIVDNQTKRVKTTEGLIKEGDWRWVMLGNYTSASPLLINNGATSKITYQPTDISYSDGKGLEVLSTVPLEDK